LEQFWVRGMPVVVGERPHALSPSYGIANGRHGFFFTPLGLMIQLPQQAGGLTTLATSTTAFPLSSKSRLH
jgi:hypothetical protein